MLMQTGWIQASRLRSNLFATQSAISNKKQTEFKGFKKKRQSNLFLENYPAFKGLKVYTQKRTTVKVDPITLVVNI